MEGGQGERKRKEEKKSRDGAGSFHPSGPIRKSEQIERHRPASSPGDSRRAGLLRFAASCRLTSAADWLAAKHICCESICMYVCTYIIIITPKPFRQLRQQRVVALFPVVDVWCVCTRERSRGCGPIAARGSIGRSLEEMKTPRYGYR